LRSRITRSADIGTVALSFLGTITGKLSSSAAILTFHWRMRGNPIEWRGSFQEYPSIAEVQPVLDRPDAPKSRRRPRGESCQDWDSGTGAP
jgi:hypothetical protein